jgi:hypothetical protein
MARARAALTKAGAGASSAGPKQPTEKETPRELAAAAAPVCFRHVLTSGLFGLPANAQSVDWMVLNDSPGAEAIRVTVFRAGVGPKTDVAPGPLTLTVNSMASTHNANSVGPGQPFVHGFYYEVVLETNDRRVLPSVHVWQDRANTVIPGTLISPATFVEV